jgi:drug/metabolite transporter (DMT)-like permease
MITGGSVVLSGVFALIFFGEKLSGREWLSIALCLAGTCMFL